MPHQATTISLVVPRTLVKTVKSALEAIGQLSKDHKIRSANSETGQVKAGSFVIPTRLASLSSIPSYYAIQDTATLKEFLREIGLAEYAADIDVIWDSGEMHKLALNSPSASLETTHGVNAKNLLSCAIDGWVTSISENVRHLLLIDNYDQESLFPRNKAYMVYPPLLLLPSNFFSKWPSEFSRAVLPEDLERLYQLLCAAFQVTHIAVNGAIPLVLHHQIPTMHALEQIDRNPNTLRSPINLTSLYGDFGPLLPLSETPSVSDFNQAFWCTACQNGILQTWAPRYTMFSRGNISEKARILRLDTMTKERLGCLPEETSAVDLYAGIGYFAFSYAKAGIGKVLCWEINPWSIEGLRRGAEGNRWSVKKVTGNKDGTMNLVERSQLVVFEESNEYASETLEKVKDGIPPVRHVNCGLLPSSQSSWKTAVQLIDTKQDGWIHAHENIAKKDIQTRGVEIAQVFSNLANGVYESAPKATREVTCEHIERVKSYAPGVIHCVLDICIGPLKLPP